MPAVATESKRMPPPEAEIEACQPSVWKQLALGHWVALVVGASVIAHGFLLSQGSFHGGEDVLSPEVSLGHYQFVDQKQTGETARAQFELFVNLLSEVDVPARARLAARKFRVQQDIEELLRQAHAGDFDDPTLTELKRQLQEKINQTLQMRSIEDVIITGLVLEGRGTPAEPAPPAKSAAAVPAPPVAPAPSTSG